MTNPHEIKIEDFDYELAEERIAKYPLEKRENSKLLIYKDGQLSDGQFCAIKDYLPKETLLLFNDSKVLPVRLHFPISDTAAVEIFCLEPMFDIPESKGRAQWKCFVGRIKKWKEKKLTLIKASATVSVELIEKTRDACTVEFTWSDHLDSMHEVLEHFGAIPIPPYLKRKSEEIDTVRYQNVFANQKGSVAAPTAGLHFTKPIIDAIKENGASLDFVTLHVGAGTFKPVNTPTIGEHAMHLERMTVTVVLIDKLIHQIKANKSITAVGTTTLRTLESLYWLGVKIHSEPNVSLGHLKIEQWEPYKNEHTLSSLLAIQAIKDYLDRNQQTALQFSTEILILPSYKFRMIDCLITNFHQPKSTLLLLVAAATGNTWRTIYDHALHNKYRFLSYGDSSLLFIGKDYKV